MELLLSIVDGISLPKHSWGECLEEGRVGGRHSPDKNGGQKWLSATFVPCRFWAVTEAKVVPSSR